MFRVIPILLYLLCNCLTASSIPQCCHRSLIYALELFECVTSDITISIYVDLPFLLFLSSFLDSFLLFFPISSFSPVLTFFTDRDSHSQEGGSAVRSLDNVRRF